MPEKLRKTGIDVIGDRQWGTHFCQFYHDKQDLLDILVPYFKAGLENNEFCMWITSEPLGVEEAGQEMAEAIPDFSEYFKKGQIEILPYNKWYLENGNFDIQRVLSGWVQKLNKGLENGFDGLRLTGNTLWLEKKDWSSFTEYEAAVNAVIGKYRMLALCTYRLDKCCAMEILDVVRNHEFAVIKKEGNWVLFENSSYQCTKEALIESETKFRHLYHSMNEGVALHEVMYDASGKAVDYIITDVNPAFENILDLEKNQAIGAIASKLYGVGEPPYLDIYAGVASSGQPVSFETYFSPMKKYFNISAFSPEKGSFATVFSDITYRKQMEKALRESEEKYRRIVELANDGVWITDAEGKIVFANQKMADMLGYTTREMIGRAGSEFLEEDQKELAQKARTELNYGTKTQREFKFRRKNGLILWAISSSSPVLDENGHLTSVVSMLKDITIRKRSEEVLERQKKNLQIILDNAHTQLAFLDPYFNFVAVNSAYAQSCKRVPEELLGKNHFILFPDEENEEIFKQARDTGQAVSFHDKPFFFPDQPERGITYWDWKLTPIQDLSGKVNGLVFSQVETTERKKAEMALQRSNDKFRLLSEIASLLLTSETPEYIVESICRKVMDYLDCQFFFNYLVDEEKQCLHMNTCAGVPPETAKAIEWLDYGVAVCGCVARDGYRIVAENIGEVPDERTGLIQSFGVKAYCCHPLLVHGKLIGTLSFGTSKRKTFAADEINLMRTISDQVATAMENKLTERALKETGDYLNNLLNHANAPIIVWGPDYRITRFNRAFERLTGRTADEVIGKELDMLFPNDSREQSMEYIRRAVAGERWEVVEIPIQQKDGSVLTVLWNSATLWGSDNKTPVATIAQGQDITLRKKAEQEVKRLNDSLMERARELENANRELEAFSYSVSHDLRAPLRGMDGFSQAILEDYSDKLDAQGKEYLHHIRRSSQLMAQLIDDILNLSRITRTELYLKKVNLSELAEEVFSELKKIRPECHVEIKIMSGLIAYGDMRLLKLVLQNLIDNAIKFSSKCTIPAIEFGATQHNGETAYFVRDNGTGFDMEYIDKLFKPFHRLHKSSEFTGTGIGLASVQRIIHRLGGRVWAEGKLEKGATFYFTLRQ